MRRALTWLAATLLLAGLLALAWWGWQQGGLALLLQGMGAC